MTTEHEKYMSRCLKLASSAEGLTAPNPMVGALLVYDGRIIAEGKHAYYGAPHAEPDAISKVQDNDILKKCTLYVNLEPCCHYGKTPPCTEKIISAGISRVVVGALDTSSKINGNGIATLNNAGIKTEVGILEKESRLLNKFFYTYHEKTRPYILLKWAQTKDGFIDSNRKTPNTRPASISNTISRIATHHLRSCYQAIMVGTNTVVMDNPCLTTRFWYGKNPTRITMDRYRKLNSQYNIFNNEANTIIYTSSDANYGENTEIVHTNSFNVQDIINNLYTKKIQSLIVEGGTVLLESFIKEGLWDEANIFTSNSYLRNGVKAPALSGTIISESNLNTDVMTKVLRLDDSLLYPLQ